MNKFQKAMASLTMGFAIILTAAPSEFNILSTPTAEASSASQQHAFFNQHGNTASEVAYSNNIYASVMLAQMALESNFGQSGLSSPPVNNLFGIKGQYNGNSVALATKEDDGNGNLYSATSNFRAYPTPAHSMQDYADLMNKRYTSTKMDNTNSYKDATQALQGTYATDTQYASKLNSIIERYNLTKYDNIAPAVATRTVQVTSDENTAPSYTKIKEHRIVTGDTLNKIATAYETSVDEIKSLNNLSSDLIFAGDTLTVEVEYTPKTHEIASGDTLFEIAEKYETSVDELKVLNHLSSDLIITGDTLIVE